MNQKIKTFPNDNTHSCSYSGDVHRHIISLAYRSLWSFEVNIWRREIPCSLFQRKQHSTLSGRQPRDSIESMKRPFEARHNFLGGGYVDLLPRHVSLVILFPAEACASSLSTTPIVAGKSSTVHDITSPSRQEDLLNKLMLKYHGNAIEIFSGYLPLSLRAVHSTYQGTCILLGWLS